MATIHSESSTPMRVGIVGGGIAGLYAALLLQREGHSVHIFEGTEAVGGRVCTHYFTSEPDQYFEAGAMRIPNSPDHQITFDLIDYLNEQLPQEKLITVIPYILNSNGNVVYVNGRVVSNGSQPSSTTPRDIGWDVPDDYLDRTASELMQQALEPLLPLTFEDLVDEYDRYTFRYYLLFLVEFPNSVVDFLETVMSQTNQFALSVTELVMQNRDFDTTEWKTIDQGMSRLPQAMAFMNPSVGIIASGYNGTVRADYDKVILAIPPAALKMIADRPSWGVKKEMAIRSMHFEALYKVGLRFKTRFWEDVESDLERTDGGQDTTDLPIRWVVFPSNGIGSPGPGVLLVYAWMTDASTWLPLTPLERRSLALYCIQKLYQGKKDKNGNTIDVFDLLVETSDVVWSASTATGDAMFLPGQFKTRFEAAREPEAEGQIYFAGEHLSHHHTWISGAADSALYAVRTLLGDPNLEPLQPRQPEARAAPTESSQLGRLGRNVGQHTALRFEFTPNIPRFPGKLPTAPFSIPKFPLQLGFSDEQNLGPQRAHIKMWNVVDDAEYSGM